MRKILDRTAALRELRALVGTYLESSDDAPRVRELLDALSPRGAVDQLVELTAGPELGQAARSELRQLVADLVANDPYLSGLVSAIVARAALRSTSSNITGRVERCDCDVLDRIGAPPIETASARYKREEREREMFGCEAAAIDDVLTGKEPRDIAMYAMGTLSNAQEMLQVALLQNANGVESTIADRHANTIRQLINVAKYAIDKAVPR